MSPEDRQHAADPIDRVQCPNCCRLAPVTARSMGLLFFRCELCESVGAIPDPPDAPSSRPAAPGPSTS